MKTIESTGRRQVIPPAWRLAARLAYRAGLGVQAIASALDLPASTIRGFVVGWRPLPGEAAKAAEERLRLLAFSEVGLDPESNDAAKFWPLLERHARQLVLIAGEHERAAHQGKLEASA